jgi:nucleoid-associated protein YgaU
VHLTIVSGFAATLLWQMSASLPLPEGFSRSEAEQWLLDHGPLLASFALLRGVALVAAVYAAFLGVIGMVAVLAQSAVLAELAVRLTVPSLRPLVAPIAACTLTLGSALPAGAAAAGESPPRPPVMQVSHDAPSGSRGAPVMQLVPGAVAPPVPPTTVASYTVTAGDSFWSIAVATLQQATEHAPTDAQVVPYWRALIEANRDRLVVPGDPDLIYPGQTFTVPPVN